MLAVGPFHLRRRGRLTAVRFLGHGLGALSAPVVTRGARRPRAALWTAVLEPRSHHLQLVTHDARDPSLGELRRVAGAGLRIRWEDVCPTIDVADGSTPRWRDVPSCAGCCAGPGGPSSGGARGTRWRS